MQLTPRVDHLKLSEVLTSLRVASLRDFSQPSMASTNSFKAACNWDLSEDSSQIDSAKRRTANVDH